MDSLWGRCRPRAEGAAPVALLTALAALGLLTPGCSERAAPAPAPTTTTLEPTAEPATSAATAPASAPAFDCTAVQDAQDELDEAFAAELERLDVDRGDPRAQSVYALVTTEQGPAYYADVLRAAPPELGDDARRVLDYYERLASAAGELDPGSGSAADLTASVDALDRAAAAVDDPAAGTAVVQAQERLRAAMERSCEGDAPATASATASPSTPPADPTTAPGSAPGPPPGSAPAATTGAATGA
ncbi:hypothetical protein [Kineococcus gypseus]|uniref:hypothetical protein n=1 Tax=Kineococcus gypseus TaxID=1637102 RepID=UPI003D7EF919